MKTVLSAALSLLLSVPVASASPKKYDKESAINVSPTTQFKISPGWSFDESESKLISPEGDLKAWLLEKPFETNVEALSLRMWRTVDPKFKLKVEKKLAQPPKDGWEAIHFIVYEVPVRENRVVATEIRVFQGKAHILLLDSSMAGISKRMAQLNIATDTWRPAGMKAEDLSGNKAQAFQASHAAALDEFVHKAMKDLSIPGVSVAVVQADKVVYRKAFGVKQLGRKEKVTTDTLFMIGSTTKPLTTLMLAKLVEEGKLSWDTPVQKILPAFTLRDKEAASEFLVKHTACACTGMPRNDMGFIFGGHEGSLEQEIQKFQDMKPTTGFGETFQYSNQVVALGGVLGAQVYNKGTDFLSKYENVMNDLVFSPLGMTSTRVKPRPADAPRLASPHAYGFKGEMTRMPDSMEDIVYTVAPAGSVWSSVEDLAQYVMMELNRGQTPQGKRLFAEEQVLMRRRPGVKVSETAAYGLGLFLDKEKGLAIISHGGNTLGFTHGLYFLPDHDIGLIVQTNAAGTNAFTEALFEKLLEILLGAAPRGQALMDYALGLEKDARREILERVSVKPADLKWLGAFLGDYHNKDLGKVAILKKGQDYILKTERWESPIGSVKEEDGERALALLAAPWSGTYEMRVQEDPKKLILDDVQVSYEFVPEKK